MTTPPSVDTSLWVDEYGDYLYRYALLRLRDPSTAMDAVQETFLAGIKGLDRYDGRVEVRFWLRGILHNKIVDHIRKAVRERPVEDIEGLQMANTFLFKASGIPTTRPSALGFDPHLDYEKAEFWECFMGCLERLGGTIRQAFTLKVLEGMKSEEVCKVLEINANHLWVLTYRAREQLKQCLSSKWLEE